MRSACCPVPCPLCCRFRGRFMSLLCGVSPTLLSCIIILCMHAARAGASHSMNRATSHVLVVEQQHEADQCEPEEGLPATRLLSLRQVAPHLEQEDFPLLLPCDAVAARVIVLRLLATHLRNGFAAHAWRTRNTETQRPLLVSSSSDPAVTRRYMALHVSLHGLVSSSSDPAVGP